MILQEAEESFRKAVLDELQGLREKGKTHGEAIQVLLKKISNGKVCAVKESEITRLMQWYGFSHQDAHRALVVSEEVKLLKARGMDAVDAVSELIARITQAGKGQSMRGTPSKPRSLKVSTLRGSGTSQPFLRAGTGSENSPPVAPPPPTLHPQVVSLHLASQSQSQLHHTHHTPPLLRATLFAQPKHSHLGIGIGRDGHSSRRCNSGMEGKLQFSHSLQHSCRRKRGLAAVLGDSEERSRSHNTGGMCCTLGVWSFLMQLSPHPPLASWTWTVRARKARGQEGNTEHSIMGIRYIYHHMTLLTSPQSL
ncbi:unnamed protein product [Chrysoparadoxa australica]